MNVLVVGSGAREHAIVWKLRQSSKTEEIYVAPGNAGTAALAHNIELKPTDIEGLAAGATKYHIDLTVVGPEAPLAEGIVDHFNRLGLAIFGPTRAAARLESSKVFAKELMATYDIPCAQGRAFSNPDEAREHISNIYPPVVVKADGLAAGKGVTVAQSREEASAAVSDAMEARRFGQAGERVIIEECLTGRELSVFAFTDGTTVTPPVAACDYKRALEGDQGPNTGGMGSYSPPQFLDEYLTRQIYDRILVPVVRAMASEGIHYKGVLYGGLMITAEGPKVLEFNVRLGDPEAQVILPRLDTDLADIMLAVVKGSLDRLDIRWMSDNCIAVVMASEGYPGAYATGHAITGLDSLDEGILVFHAGTSLGAQGAEGGPGVVTAGGRVLSLVARGTTLAEARDAVYRNVDRIHFQGANYRKDIAAVPSPASCRVSR